LKHEKMYPNTFNVPQCNDESVSRLLMLGEKWSKEKVFLY